MKIKEVRELETKDLAERIEAEVAKYNQMKLNHAISPLENMNISLPGVIPGAGHAPPT